MRRYIERLGGAIALALAVLPGAAQAGPVIAVSIGTPSFVAPGPVPVQVVLAPAAPAPGWVWVEASWRRDAFGRPIFVAGHWVPPPAVVSRPAPRAVVVHRTRL